MSRSLARTILLLGTVLVNIAIATPATAALDDDFCQDSGGGLSRCCTTCIIFCTCTLI